MDDTSTRAVDEEHVTIHAVDDRRATSSTHAVDEERMASGNCAREGVHQLQNVFGCRNGEIPISARECTMHTLTFPRYHTGITPDVRGRVTL